MNEIRKPNFFIIGAPKSGTSSLINTLRWHPDIYVPLAFEPQYFSSDFSSVLDYTPEKYLELYSGVTDKHLAIGEKSVIYLYSDVAVDNIMDFNPDAKLIVMLRNPVDLVYSWHSQLYYSFIEDIESFNKAWDAQDERRQGQNIPERCTEPFALQYREIGLLSKYLQRVYEKVPSDRIKVFFMEDFHMDADTVYREALKYLEVPYKTRKDSRKLNKNKRHRSRWLGKTLAHDSKTTASKMMRRFEKLPLINKFPVKYWLHELNKVEYKRNPLDPEMRKHLVEEFREDIGALAELTGRDLQHWQ
jgi:hypothetical protein